MLAFASLTTFAAETETAKAKTEEAKVDAFDQAAMDAVRNKIETNLTGLPVDEINPSPLGNWFEVLSRGELYYVTRDGNHLFTGQLIEIKNGMVNLTAQSKRLYDKKLSPMRKEVINKIPDSDTIYFPAENEKHRISVFVDVTCGYCKKLHHEVPSLNAMGVTVRYLAYPRAGMSSSASKTLQSVWCSDDRKAAITEAFNSRAIAPKTCKNPVADQYGLVRSFALTGTPNIIFENGDLWPGYLKATDIVSELTKRGL
jgi:thiol:disulfide interchange protein DsbC